jgi:hypothetical protein
MKTDSFVFELLKSFPVKALIVLVTCIFMGVAISKCKEKKVQMKEDVLYVHPKPKV